MIVTPTNLDVVCAAISKHSDRALDTETTGLEYHDRPFAVIIATPEDVYYFDGRCCPDFWSAPKFLGLFDDDCTWHYQNAKFDMSMVDRMIGKVPTKVNDIAVQARIVRNDYLAYSLEAQGKRIDDFKLDIAKEYVKKHNLYETRKDFFGVEYTSPKYHEIPLDVMAPYAEQDGKLTLKLYFHYLSKMDEGDKRVWEMEKRLTPILYRMEKLGVLIDKKYTLDAYYYELGLVNNYKDNYALLTGATYTDSAKSFQKHLEYQLPITDKGNPSIDSDVIEDILQRGTPKDKEIASIIREIRHIEKRISTYYTAFLNKMDPNGYIHCTMWQGGTRTGRMSSSDPNLQNVPKEDDDDSMDLNKVPYVVRGCIVPRPGNKFVSFDYSQMEYRMMAAYANETEIIKRVMSGEDFHRVTATLFNVARKTAKTLNFAILYGAGIPKLAGMLGVMRLEARRLKDRYFMALPKVEQFVDKVIDTGRRRGYVINWLGRKLYAAYEFCYALPNHLIQGGGADVVKMAMVLIGEEMPFLNMVLQVHDQLVFDMPPEHEKYIPRIKEIMESIWEKNGMKLTVDISVSRRSFAERDMEKWKE